MALLIPPPSLEGPKAQVDAIAQAFPFYHLLLRLLMRWDLSEVGSRPAWRSRLVVFLTVVWLIDLIWSIPNILIYSKDGIDPKGGEWFMLTGSLWYTIAPLFGYYVSRFLLPQLKELQPGVRSYMNPEFNQLHKRHKFWQNLVLCIPIVAMIIIVVSSVLNIINLKRYEWKTPTFLNFLYHTLLSVVVAGGLAPLAFSIYTFDILVCTQSIQVFQRMLVERNPAIRRELDPETPLEERLILAVPPPPSTLRKPSTRTGALQSPSARAVTVAANAMSPSIRTTENPLHATASPIASSSRKIDGNREDAISTLEEGGLKQPDLPAIDAQPPVTVDEVLKLQRAMQLMVKRHSAAWQLPVFAALLTAALLTAIAALNLIVTKYTDTGIIIWMIVGPAIILMFLAPAVSLNTAWTSILTSPDMDWSAWETGERSWLTSRFSLSPVAYSVVGIAFDFPSLLKLLITSLTPLIVSQALALKDNFSAAVVKKE